ncbi:TonB-dependent receptor [Lysobacter sp. M2-1]|uniref:TonB-dependent receptor domain-containing protein n=1 Tax=Lysobacter sp. M2-1 TaxID=2916839 RepID=UPI001F55D692
MSPKLGAVWRFAPGWSLFGGYARGFRAPPYNDVNIGFTNVQFGYTAIANPDLRPETSDGLEAGLRYGSRVLFAELTGYYNRYDDFIESMAVVGFDPVRQLLVFQSRNVAEATIYGAEARAGLDLGALSGALQGWSLRGAAAWSRGDNETEDVPLDGVEPPTASLGIAFQREAWGAELAARFVGRRDRLPSASDPQPGAEPVRAFESPGYVVLDLYAHWRFAPGVRLDAGLFNLGDRKYFYAGDVPLVAADSVQLDRYTAAGRNLALSVAVEW